MASLRKRGRFWYVRLRDECGKQKEVKASPDRGVANQIKRDLESTQAKIKAGILDPRDVSAIEAERVPLAKHVDDYLRFLTAKGCVPDHVNAVRIKLKWLLRKTGVIRLSQLKASLVVEALAELKASGRSDRTIFHYATVAKSFANWLKKDHRTRFDLLEDLDRPAVVTEGERPALSPEQTARLIDATATSPPRCGMSGPDRSWFYALAATTGLRRLELQALTPESFDLDGPAPVVTLPPPRTKNRKGAVQPLPGIPRRRPTILAGRQACREDPLPTGHPDGRDDPRRPQGRWHPARRLCLPQHETHLHLGSRGEWRVGQGLHGAGPPLQAGPDLQEVQPLAGGRSLEGRQCDGTPVGDKRLAHTLPTGGCLIGSYWGDEREPRIEPR